MSGERGVDVLVVGAGVLGRSVAFALAAEAPGIRVVLAGDPVRAGASRAAGAMLGVLGEVTPASLGTHHGRLRLALAVEAARVWPSWRRRVREAAGAGAAVDGWGAGTYMLLNAVSSRLDDAAFAAIAAAADEYGLGCHDADPDDIPGYRPLDNDRALRALYLPGERFLDARTWLATLDAALDTFPGVVRTGPGDLTTTPAGRYRLSTPEGHFTAPRALVCAGAWTTPLLSVLDPDLPVVPVLAAAGTALTVSAPQPLPAVLRTPNRAYACGLHAVPQADGTWYVGATSHPALTPSTATTPGALRSLLDSALGQLHHGMTTVQLTALHHGNRPIGLDGHPVIGPTLREGLWVASGTHRDGLHASPLLATTLAQGLLTPTSTGRPLPEPLRPWAPCRTLITDLTREQAAAEAAAHHAALAAESRMRPPLSGSWPDALTESYLHMMEQAYTAMPDGYVPPPDLAPLAYENTRPALAKLAAAHLDRHHRSTR
ncbi:NAD(P)/FAD-dependent oxidoreductase [Streptomyces sp. NPDC004284]|uniref:NAD(P)/FAD-dependent oxidoreductase n=1 Tax=Streptomyces sp. NPDC004284 TaxID=3364695 RepID=UPI0036B7670A